MRGEIAMKWLKKLEAWLFPWRAVPAVVIYRWGATASKGASIAPPKSARKPDIGYPPLTPDQAKAANKIIKKIHEQTKDQQDTAVSTGEVWSYRETYSPVQTHLAVCRDWHWLTEQLGGRDAAAAIVKQEHGNANARRCKSVNYLGETPKGVG
jgi:hypothetical protein